MKWQHKSYSFPIPMRFVLSKRNEQELVVMLHGFQDNAHSMLKRIGWLDQEPIFPYLALNGPFPVPVWNAQGFKEAYSWYFRDTSRDLVIVTPQTTAERVAALLNDLGLAKHRIVIFGFSMGGYLAPYVAKHLPNVRAIIGLGCGYTDEAYTGLKALPVYAIHGAKDETVKTETARQEYAAIAARGFTGGFHEIPDLTHRVQTSLEPMISNWIQKSFHEGEP